MATYIGVDFSGSAEQWGHRRNKSNVWISVIVKDDADCCMVTDLFRVQRCMNTFRAEHPFEALGQFLRQTDFVAAGIDAPFSIPKEYVPKQGYGELLNRTASIGCKNRPFPRGADFLLNLGTAIGVENLPVRGRKSYRETEEWWRRRGINVRSTLWNGPRGGAPFTVACLKLLGQAKLPIWPWTEFDAETRQLLVEAFPAAQLSTWALPCSGYNGDDGNAREVRQGILEGIESKHALSFDRQEYRHTVLGSADPLDAVVCAFAAVAVAESRLVSEPSVDTGKLEGWIAAHR